MTSPLEALGMIALRRLDPEAAHGLALKALQMGLGPKSVSQRFHRTLQCLKLSSTGTIHLRMPRIPSGLKCL